MSSRPTPDASSGNATGAGTDNRQDTAGAEPVLEPARFHQLAEELESRTAAADFVGAYLQLLPARVDRILTALSQGNSAAAMEATLSLKVTSSMAGAPAMEHSCRRLQASLAEDRDDEAAAIADLLAPNATELEQALTELLAPHPDRTGLLPRPAERPGNPVP
jgi:histidine phosphotransfer protein HptB